MDGTKFRRRIGRPADRAVAAEAAVMTLQRLDGHVWLMRHNPGGLGPLDDYFT